MAISWDKDRTERLISLVEERPCLYNMKLKIYFNRDLRKRAHEEIAETIGLSGKKTVLCKIVCMYCCSSMYSVFLVDEVQKKIKSFRTQYTRERQKVKNRKSGDGADDIYTSKWIHFPQLQFLDDFVTAKKTVSNYRKVQYIQ